MKTITKLLLAFMAIVIAHNCANAQMTNSSPLRFGIGLDGGIPTGNLHGLSNVAIGGTARLQYRLDDKISLTATAGYYNFFAKKTGAVTTPIGQYIYTVAPHDQGLIPVKAGFKAFFDQNFYLNIEGGVGFETKYNEDVKMIVAPGLGYASKSWDVGVRYENFSGQSNNYGLIGLRIAYGFAL